MADENLEYPITPNYSPEVTVEISGIKSGIKVVGIVDTGFTGFVHIPLAIGLKAGLTLWGIRGSILADGSKTKDLECYGKIKFAGKEFFGFFTCSETGEDTLLGMQFLHQLEMDFTVSPTRKRATFSPVRTSTEKVSSEEPKTD